MGFIDSHAHLNFPQFSGDLEEVLTRAKASGLSGFINIGTDLKTSEESVALASHHPNIFATVGIHPHDAQDITRDLAALTGLAANPKVIGIGEIGLDFFRNLSPVSDQEAGFRAQLALALSVKKPVVLHCRDAYQEVLDILAADYLPYLSGRPPGILHSFAANPHYASKFVAQGFYLGINNLSGYPQNEDIREAIRMTSLDRLVLETDCPFLPPQALRGQRSEPAHVVPVAELIAEIKGVSIEEVMTTTTKNLITLFGVQW